MVEIVFGNQREACTYALDRSTDSGVLAASVARYLLGELGTRHAAAWFVGGRPDVAPTPTGRSARSAGSGP